MMARILPADLAVLQQARLRAELAAARAEIAAKDVEVLNLRAFVRYGLTDADKFDITTGAITRAEPAPEAPAEAPPAAPAEVGHG